MLSKAGLDVLHTLDTGTTATPAELAETTSYSQAHLYEVLDKLLDAGLLSETRGHKNQRQVRVAGHPVVDAYRMLLAQLGHVDWAELLSPATLRVCWYLDEPRRVAEIADRLDITRQAVHNALAPLKGRALLSPAGPEYALSDDLEPLLAFARAVVAHDHRQRVRKRAPSATIAWCDPKRALVRPQTADDTETLQSDSGWQVTGLARMRDHGLQFFLAGEPGFWYGPEATLTPAEIVCHTLVLDSDSRRVSYAMLLIEQLEIDQETLTATAAWYDLEPTIEALYQALDGETDNVADDVVSLPSNTEFMRLKEQYGVS